MPKDITRRGFIDLVAKGSGAALGVSLFGLPGFSKLFAQTVQEVPVLWLQAGACTGCSVSVLNSLSPTIQDVLLGQVIPGKHVSMAFHPNVSAGQGDMIVKLFDSFKNGSAGSHVLVIEGGISTKDDGIYCEVGEKNGHGITVLQHLKDLAPKAMAVISMGTCAAYGGIPMAPPNPTGIKPVSEVLKENGIETPVVNIPGCPPHPDWFVGTVATVLIGGLGAVSVDEFGRPLAFFDNNIHNNCERRGQFDQGKFAADFSQDGCLYKLGCRGPMAHADCSTRRWNSGVNWCIGSGSPCNACVEPGYPFPQNLYEVVPISAATPPNTYPPIVADQGSNTTAVATGIIGAAVGAGVGYVISQNNGEKEE